MNVLFYTCSADPRVVDKTSYLSGEVLKTCEVYQQTGVMHPSLLINYDSSIVNKNYFKIPEWGNRFYHLVGIEVTPGQRMIVSGSEDVLYTNKDSIYALNAYVKRTEGNNINKFIVDNKMPIQANRQCETIKFNASPFIYSSGYNFVLTVSGGVASQ